MYQMYLTLHVQVVFLQDDPANSLVILDGLHSTCGENSSVNQPNYFRTIQLVSH